MCQALKGMRSHALGGETMSKVIDAVYENGVFRPLEPVLLGL